MASAAVLWYLPVKRFLMDTPARRVPGQTGFREAKMVLKGAIITVWLLVAGLILAVSVDMGKTWWETANVIDTPVCPAPVEGIACG